MQKLPSGPPGLSVAQVNELWVRFRAGETVAAIAKAFGLPAGTLYPIVHARGGVAPRPRQRAVQALTSVERETISRGLAAGESVRAIARTLNRAPSTVSREIQRNAGATRYRAATADRRAWHAARRPKPGRLAQHTRLCGVVARKLRACWSPQQISGWLMTAYPGEAAMHVSHETIYRSLFVQTRGELKRELTAHLRTARPVRRSKKGARNARDGGSIADAVSIRDRPAAVEDRAIPGHWEGDLLQGKNFSFVATLVERWSRYVHLVRVTGKDTQAVTTALIREAPRVPFALMASLTWDRGTEMAGHQRFSVATDVAVYFCDPRSPWQRGTNENTNGLLRQYFPVGMDLSTLTQRQLDAVARKLNTRPRKTLGYKTPAAMLFEAVATTD